MKDSRIVIGKRRFTCLTPTLVRMEFSPDGIFEERRSLVAYAEQTPIAFASQTREKGQTLLETGKMTIMTSENDRAFFSRQYRGAMAS